MNKKFFLVTILISIFILTTGCNSSSNHSEQTDDNKVEPESLHDKTADEEDLTSDIVEYVGQIDANSIEVKLNGTQTGDEDFRAFRLSEQIKESFEKLKLEEGMQITIHYKQDENGNNIIYGLQKGK